MNLPVDGSTGRESVVVSIEYGGKSKDTLDNPWVKATINKTCQYVQVSVIHRTKSEKEGKLFVRRLCRLVALRGVEVGDGQAVEEGVPVAGGRQPPQPRPPLLQLALALQPLELLVLAAVAADGRIGGGVVCTERVGWRDRVEGEEGSVVVNMYM